MLIHKIPLLKDYHNHPLFYASLYNKAIDIRNIKDKEKVLNLFKDFNPNQISIVLGWLTNYYTFSNNELDKYGPLIIFNSSLHSLMVNTSAKELVKAKYQALLNNLGNKTWIEKNLVEIFKFIIEISSPDTKTLKNFYEHLLDLGIYYAEEMTLYNEQEIVLFEKANLSERTRFWVDPTLYENLNPEIKEKIHGIKIIIDGAIGSKTARLKYRYLDNQRGILNYSKKGLCGLFKKIKGYNKPISVHAIGDEAIELAINTLADINSVPDARIEHALLISKNSAKKAKENGIKLCMQPNFSVNTNNYADRLNLKYCKSINPFRMLIDEIGYKPGKDLFFGSDGMPHGVKKALQLSLFPPLDTQTLKIEEIVDGYCLDSFDKGFIEVKIDEQARQVECKIHKKL